MNDRSEGRHPVTIQGRYRTGQGRPSDVVVTDLSERGCRIFDRVHILDPGTTISIRIGSIGPLLATVKWRNGKEVGLEFDNPLYPSVMEHMRYSIDNWKG